MGKQGVLTQIIKDHYKDLFLSMTTLVNFKNRIILKMLNNATATMPCWKREKNMFMGILKEIHSKTSKMFNFFLTSNQANWQSHKTLNSVKMQQICIKM